MTSGRFTPGPWQWAISPKSNSVSLDSLSAGRPIVLEARRWGMGGATLWVKDMSCPDRCLIAPIHESSIPAPGREHHADWFRITRHPDMQLIAAAPEMYAALMKLVQPVKDVPAYLEAISEGIAALMKAKGEG